jgi:hypothetical protein
MTVMGIQTRRRGNKTERRRKREEKLEQENQSIKEREGAPENKRHVRVSP